MRKPLTPALTALALGEPILPVGFRRDGRPIFPIAGGSEDPPAGPPAGDKTFTQAEVDQIILKRAERVAADKYGDYADLKTKAARLDEIEQANASEMEKAIKKAREEGRAEVQTSANKRLVSAEARALAAQAKFANPTLAVRAIDLDDIEVGDDGKVDTAAIQARLKEAAESGAFVVGDEKKPAPRSDPSQGGGGAPPSKAQEGLAEARKRFGTPTGQQ